MVQDDKYVVFKADEFDHWWMHKVRPRLEGVIDQPPEQLVDAVVIRTQDVFAAGGLSAYANQIETVIEVGGVPQDDVLRLEEIRDYFFDRAREAEQSPDRKLPD